MEAGASNHCPFSIFICPFSCSGFQPKETKVLPGRPLRLRVKKSKNWPPTMFYVLWVWSIRDSAWMSVTLPDPTPMLYPISKCVDRLIWAIMTERTWWSCVEISTPVPTSLYLYWTVLSEWVSVRSSIWTLTGSKVLRSWKMLPPWLSMVPGLPTEWLW